jgi:hypothetical protein
MGQGLGVFTLSPAVAFRLLIPQSAFGNPKLKGWFLVVGYWWENSKRLNQ